MGEKGDLVYLLCPNFAKIICDGIKSLYEKKNFADLILSIDDQKSHVHTFMMAVFAPNLLTLCKENVCNLNNTDVNQETLSYLLDFIYKGQIKVERKRLKELKDGADKLGIKLLINEIDKEIKVSTVKRKNRNILPDPDIIKITEVEYVVEGEVENAIESLEIDSTQKNFVEKNSLNLQDRRCANQKIRIKFKCGDCDFQSDNQQELLKHRQIEHAEKESEKSISKCPNCDFASDRKVKLKHHMGYCCAANDKPIKCEVESCSYRCRTEKELKKHIEKQHDKEIYECKECEKCFEGKFSLTNHMKLNHTLPEERHVCNFCDFKTRYMLDLKRHQSEKHNYRPPRIQKRKVYTDADLKPCPHCNLMLKNRPLLVDHLAYHHQVDLEGNPIQPQLQCKLCDFKCWAHFQLHNHVYQNHTEKQFRCEHCNYACRRRRALAAHVLGKHFNQKAFMCELCGQCFAYNATLKRHLQLHQSGKAFTCSSCGKIFSQKIYLESHVKSVHSKIVARHQCQMCIYSASTKGNLMKHVRRKHKGATEFREPETVLIDEIEEVVVSEMGIGENDVLIQRTDLDEIIFS